MDNAKIKCWGSNGSGQLGLGDADYRGNSQSVMGHALEFVSLGANHTFVVEVYAGAYHSCARFATGQVKCWGKNNAK